MDDNDSRHAQQPLTLRARTTLVRKGADPATLQPIPITTAPMVLDVPQVQALATAPANTLVRRFFFMWFRVFVYEQKPNGRVERVNVRLPLPIPLVGTLLSRRMSSRQALKALAAADQAPDGYAVIERYVDAHMGFEFIRVEDRSPTTGKYELVVVGFD